MACASVQSKQALPATNPRPVIVFIGWGGARDGLPYLAPLAAGHNQTWPKLDKNLVTAFFDEHLKSGTVRQRLWSRGMQE